MVKCTYDNFKITEEKYCDPSLKPLNERSCQIKPCIPTKGTPSQDPRSTRIIPTTTTSRQVARWHEGRWTQVKILENKTVQTNIWVMGINRKLAAVKIFWGQFSSLCCLRNRRSKRFCCCFKCSVTCGQGQRTRQVYCRFNDGKTSEECDEKKRPQTVMDCVLRACPAWHQDLWSEVNDSWDRRTWRNEDYNKTLGKAILVWLVLRRF